jgi:hypothetical protein
MEFISHIKVVYFTIQKRRLSAVVPKVGPRDFQIWSARQKNLVKFQYFMHIFVKIVSLTTSNFHFMVRRVGL